MRKLLTILFFLPLSLIAQRAEMSVDKQEIVIGEQTTLRIFFDYRNPDEDALIGWPQFDKYLGKKVEIISKTVDYESVLDSLTKTYRRQQELTVTVFEPGEFTIPALEIELNDSVYKTNEVMLLVNTVQIDTSKSITDIKPNYVIEYTFGEQAADWFRDNWHWFAIGGAILAVFLIMRLVKNRKKEEPEPEVPRIPAHITALAALRDLMHKEGWKERDKKEYYSKLTDTVRLYLEERFDIYAMEQTTREIINELKSADISESDKQYLKKILGQADMVKFAKFTPTDEDGFSSLHQSIEFVERTKKEEEQGGDETNG